MEVIKTTINDIKLIYNLYKKVAAVPGGLARNSTEISEEYIESFIHKSISTGISLHVKKNGRIIAEIHAYTPEINVFSHILSDLTICVDPDYQGHSYGRMIFSELIKVVKDKMLHIKRIELIARESNIKAIKFYESLGFVREGALRKRIYGVSGKYENDIPMGWLRED